MKRIIVFLVLLFSIAQAQTWTIQTASFRDYRLAQRSLDRLLKAGFDAYSEFYMDQGKQLVRVRVGCFENRDAAENFLNKMNSMGQISAYIIPHSLAGKSCIKRNIGFIAPENWGTYQIDNKKIIFWVSISDITAFIAHTNLGWQVSQTGSDLLSDSQASPIQHYFAQNSEFGAIYVVLPNRKPYKLTTGKLLWQSGASAVILEDDTVVSYKLSLRGQ